MKKIRARIERVTQTDVEEKMRGIEKRRRGGGLSTVTERK